MIIDKQLLDDLSAQAKVNPRLRMNKDMRTEATEACPEPCRRDQSQRMLNALEPGTVLPIHRHTKSTETVIIIRGRLIEKFYDEQGNLTEEVLMYPGCDTPIVNVEKGRWHNLECLEPNTVLFECKDGAYEPLAEEDIMTLNA